MATASSPLYDISRLQQAQAARRRPSFREAAYITAYTDASIRQGVAGWSAWMRDEAYRIVARGPCPSWVEHSTQAELCGVVAAIHLACEHFFLDAEQIAAGRVVLVIKTDSQQTAHHFGWQPAQPTQCTPKEPTCPKGVKERVLLYRGLECAEVAGVKLVVKWVKGHQRNRTTQAHLNSKADRLARQGTRQGVVSLWAAAVGREENAVKEQQRRHPWAQEGEIFP